MADPLNDDGASEDELEARRKASMGEQAAEAAAEEETKEEPAAPEGELFHVVENGRTVTFAGLLKRGTPVEVEYKMTGKSLPNTTGGIINPYDTSVLMIADCVVDSAKPTFIRDSNQQVEKVKLYIELKPRRVQQALSEAGKVMLNEAELEAVKADAA